MNNTYFLTKILHIKDEMILDACLKTMEAYGDNKWWEPGIDDRTYAYHQFHESRLFSDKGAQRMRKGLSEIVGRTVYTFDLRDVAFEQEVERAWRWGVGSTSEQEANERLEDSLNRFTQKMQGRKVIQVNLPE